MEELSFCLQKPETRFAKKLLKKEKHFSIKLMLSMRNALEFKACYAQRSLPQMKRSHIWAMIKLQWENFQFMFKEPSQHTFSKNWTKSFISYLKFRLKSM